jgi:hypothetical protein
LLSPDRTQLRKEPAYFFLGDELLRYYYSWFFVTILQREGDRRGRTRSRPVATGEGTTEDWIASKLSRDERLESFAALEERSLALPAMESAPSSFTAVPMARVKIQEGEDKFNGVRGRLHEGTNSAC